MTDIVEWLRASCARTTVIDITRLDEAADEITRLRAVLREIAKPWTARSLSVADLRQAAEMVIAELERRRAVAEAALGGGDE